MPANRLSRVLCSALVASLLSIASSSAQSQTYALTVQVTDTPAARANGIGVGWVSIIDPDEVVALLDVPDDWALVAYLCVGYPQEEHVDAELERAGWQDRVNMSSFVFTR